MTLTQLPKLMVAPNGARFDKKDHPALPITIDETIETAKACHKAGADGLHLHIRDQNGGHILDTGLYNEAIKELALQLPSMQVQITTEAVGQYAPHEQRDIVKNCLPKSVSIACRELARDGEDEVNLEFYRWCHDEEIAVQHILYCVDDFEYLDSLYVAGLSKDKPLQLLFVLGRYHEKQQSNPEELEPFIHRLDQFGIKPDWAVCAFGQNETKCLLKAHKLGGKIRVGFENSFWNDDGSLAQDNAERVNEIVKLSQKIF